MGRGRKNYLVEGLVGKRLGERTQIPQFVLALGGAVEAGGHHVRRVAQPRHLAALRSVVWRPLAHHAVLAGIEDAIHLILRGHAEEAAAVVPVQILRETLEIVRSHLITQIAVPHLASSISMRQIYILIKRRCRHGNQIGHRIELHKGHLSVMAVEGQYGLRDVLLGTSLGELPQLAINPCRNGNHHAQIRRRTDDLLVVEGVEVKIAEIASTESQLAGDSTCDPSEGAAGRASFQECGAHGSESDHHLLQRERRSILNCP